MSTIIKSTIVLTLVAFIAALALSHVKKITYPSIERQIKEKQDKALLLVLPGFRITGSQKASVDGSEFSFWTAEKTTGTAVERGYAFITKSPGYSGDVESMVGVDEKGTILGISVMRQSETPGLGARCIEMASDRTLWDVLRGRPAKNVGSASPWFQEQYKGINANAAISIVKKGDWKPSMKKELAETNAISAITGATITTIAVTRSVEKGHRMLRKALDQTGNGGEKEALK